MITITAKENSVISLTEALLDDLQTIGIHNMPQLSLSGNKITLPKYTVGELRLAEHVIQIEPLNPAMTLENVFEMFAYTENIQNTNVLNDSHSFAAGTHGFGDFIDDFLSSVEKLSLFGVPSLYKQQKAWVKKGIGTIDATKFNKKLTALHGIYARNNTYTKDSVSNRIILKALLLVKELHGDTFNARLLEPFLDIQPHPGVVTSADEIRALAEYSPNPYSSITLAYALMIVKDLTIGYSHNGSVQWHSFLVNSNQIYEKYLRAVLDRNLVQSVQKLSKPRTFAVNSTNPKDAKDVEPDILVNYNQNNSTAQMVIDAKNKKIQTKKPLSSMSTGDLYQIAYYASIFKAKAGALIYPVTTPLNALRIHLQTDAQSKFYIVGINMHDTIEKRHADFVKTIADILRNAG